MESNNPAARSLTIVFGMHRSGTSLCSQLLNRLGIDMADEETPHESNPAGHWERWEIVGAHDRLFRHFGQDYYDIMHARPLPAEWWTDPAVARIRGEIVGWLKDRMGRTRHFGFKDPRICRLMPMWRDIAAELGITPQFVFCVREPGAVAQSIVARDSFPFAEGEFRWLVYNTDAVGGIGDGPVRILPYEKWFANPMANLAALAGLNGLRHVDAPEMARLLSAIVDPALNHQAAAAGGQVSGLSTRLYRLFVASQPEGRFSPDLRTIAGKASARGFSELTTMFREELGRVWDVLMEAGRQLREQEPLKEQLRVATEQLAARRRS